MIVGRRDGQDCPWTDRFVGHHVGFAATRRGSLVGVEVDDVGERPMADRLLEAEVLSEFGGVER